MTLDLETHQLIAYLGRGGKWQNYWTAPGKRSIWFPTGKPVDPPQAGENIYFSVNPTREIPQTNALGEIKPPKFVRSRIDHIAAINALFGEFDQDKGADLEQIEAISPRPSVVIESGGGWHAYWLLDAPFLLDTPEAVKRVKVAQYGWVDYIKSDPGAKDLARVLRVPGTHNLKYDPPRPVRFCWAEFDRVYRLSELEPFISLQAEFKPAASRPHIERPISEKIDFWLNKALEKAKPGNRNATGFELACQLRDEGLSESEIISVPYPEYVPQPPGKTYTRAEWSATVRSVLSQPAREPAVSNGNGNHQVVKVYDPEPPEVFDPDFFRGMEVEGGSMVEQPQNNEDIIEYKDAWKRYTLADAYREREPRQYIADGLFILPSLNIVYGAPATFKSLLLLDLALCIASGHDFLPPAPWQGGAKPIETMQAPVMWLDFDNGKDELDERIEALARARNLSEGIPFYYFSMPNPWLDASNKASVGDLILRAKAYQAKFICIDNLGNISGDSDENSAQMVKVTGHLRQLAEATGAAVVVVHHQRKSNGTTGRSGETLRGHSSIEAALNLALLVEREEYADTVKMRATKSRGKDVMPFSAAFTFENKDNGDLKTAKFYGLTVEDTGSNYAIEREIMTALQLAGMNKTELTKTVKETLPDVGTNRIRGLIERLAATGKIREVSGPRTAKLYCLK